MKVIGIDLTSSEKKASGIVIRESSHYDYGLALTDHDIIRTCRDADIVAIDSPLRLPKDFCCLELDCPCHDGKPNGRSCERELVKRGIPLYFTTKKSIIKKMIYRAMKLADIIGRDNVIEIYPYSIKVVLFGKPVPNKSTKEGLLALKEKVSNILSIPLYELKPLNHDIIDALLACYVAELHLKGQTESVGDVAESPIIIPLASYLYVV